MAVAVTVTNYLIAAVIWRVGLRHSRHFLHGHDEVGYQCLESHLHLDLHLSQVEVVVAYPIEFLQRDDGHNKFYHLLGLELQTNLAEVLAAVVAPSLILMCGWCRCEFGNLKNLSADSEFLRAFFFLS